MSGGACTANKVLPDTARIDYITNEGLPQLYIFLTSKTGNITHLIMSDKCENKSG